MDEFNLWEIIFIKIVQSVSSKNAVWLALLFWLLYFLKNIYHLIIDLINANLSSVKLILY